MSHSGHMAEPTESASGEVATEGLEVSAVEHVVVVQPLVLLVPEELAGHEPGLVHVEAVEAIDEVLGEAPGLAVALL